MPSVSVHGMGMTTADLPHPVSSLSSSNAGLLRCRTSSVPENWKLLKAEEVQKSKLLRGASANLAEFIWPQDERPKVPHDDFQGAEELPIIDLGELLQAAVADQAATTDHQHHHQPSSTRRDKIAKDLAKIFSEWGFVQVVNHGVKTEVIDAMQTQAKKFFDLPLEQKEKAKHTRPGGSSTNEGFGYGVDSGFFYVGRPWIDRFQCRWSPVESITELADKVYTREEAHGGIDDIDAHDAAAEFRKSMEDYNKSLDKLTIQILELCAEGLGLKSSTFTEPYLGTAGDCIARFNYYPPCPLPSLTLGLGAHTDPNLLTILHQCSVGGLQICHGHGSWFSVKPSPNSFIINVGDSFEAWTNGRFKSVKHRAVVNETQSRLSIVYFSNPLPHSIMSVPHKLIDCEHPLEFRPAFTWLDYKTHLLETHKNNNNNNNNDGGRTSKLWLLRRKSILNQKVNLFS